MRRKIILNLAVSLDGYIAEEDGGFDWIKGHGDNSLDTEDKFDFNEFLEGIDIVVMGRKSAEEGFFDDYKDKKVYIATTEEIENRDNLRFIKENIVETILEEREKDGGDIYLFGGGILVDSFIKADIIDEYIIGTIPTILGKGIPLFLNNNPKIDLILKEYFINDGIIISKYIKK